MKSISQSKRTSRIKANCNSGKWVYFLINQVGEPKRLSKAVVKLIVERRG